MRLRKLLSFLTLLISSWLMSETSNIPTKIIELEFSNPQLEILESTAQINLFLGGLGSGKTYLMGARNLLLAKFYPHVRAFIGANTYQQLTKSTLVGVFTFWGKVGLRRDIDYVVDRMPPDNFKVYGEKLKKYDNTISFKNGKLIFLGSLENYEAIDGQEFAHADIDETKDSPEEAVKDTLIPRLRQKGLWLNKKGQIITNEEEAIRGGYMGYNPLFINTSPGKCEWLYEWFNFEEYEDEIEEMIFSKETYFRKRVGNKLMVISSTYHNEHNLPKGYIEEKIIEPNKHNEQKINMNLYGSPLAKEGDEYYDRFIRRNVVKEVQMPENCAVTVSFDFNRVPYITSGLYKSWFKPEVNRWHVHAFDEVCLEPPWNTTEHLCEKLLELYSHEFRNGLFYTGDYTGKNRRTNSIENDYDVIERMLKRFIGESSDRVITNEPVVQRKEFMNKVFYGSVPIDFTISPRCVKLIKDCQFLKIAPDGGKIKPKDKNGHEKYGHRSDDLEYYFTSTFYKYYKP